MEEIKTLITDCKTLLEQTEPFQKKMKAKHSRMKKRVIGHGGQSNVPPFTEKPSMKRSKSAPPIGEDFIREVVRQELVEYLLKEGMLDKIKKAGLALALGAGLAGVVAGSVAAKSEPSLQNKDRVEQQAKEEQQKELSTAYNKYFNNLMKDPENIQKYGFSKWQNDLKSGMKSNLHLQDNIADAILKDIGLSQKEGRPINIQAAIQRVALISSNAAKYEVQHKNDPDFRELNAIVHAVQQLEQQGMVNEHIVKKGSKYCLMSKKTNKNLGCYATKAGAEKREKQVQYFKHAK